MTTDAPDTFPMSVDDSAGKEVGNSAGTSSNGDVEYQANPTRRPRFSRKTVAAYLNQDITLVHADLLIVACNFVSGLCDSSAFSSWNCFVSMQTGNTVFLALGASNQPTDEPYGWVKSLSSIAVFLFGCFLCGRTRDFGPLTRRTLTLSFLFQALCIFIAAGLVNNHTVPDKPTALKTSNSPSFIEIIPLAFLALQAGFQITSSRLMGFNEVPTTVLTSVYCDLASDPQFLVGFNKNVKRNRRFGAVVLYIVGAISGGWLLRSKPGMQVCFWIGGGVKFFMAMCWLTWKAKTPIQLP